MKSSRRDSGKSSKLALPPIDAVDPLLIYCPVAAITNTAFCEAAIAALLKRLTNYFTSKILGSLPDTGHPKQFSFAQGSASLAS